LIAARSAAETKPDARAGKKEGGCGEGIFARPRFPPPPNFVFFFAKCAARKRGVVFAPPTRAHTTRFLLPKDVEQLLSIDQSYNI